MRSRRLLACIRVYSRLAALCLAIQPAVADVFMAGKVTMEDGSPPPSPVSIQRACEGGSPLKDATTNKHGVYLWRTRYPFQVRCLMYAVLAGYDSNRIDISDPRLYESPQLPVLVLRSGTASVQVDTGFNLPHGVLTSWDLAVKAMAAHKWAEAERLLRSTVHGAPKFAAAWSALGLAYQYQHKVGDAIDAYQHAIEADPKLLLDYLRLTRLEIASQRWPEAIKTAAALIKADTNHRYMEAYLDEATARYSLHDLNGAEATLKQALPLDIIREAPLLEYFMGVVLAEKGDTAGAAEHLRKYLERAPKADNTASVKAALEKLDTASAGAALPIPAQAELFAPEADTNSLAAGEASVPGGIKALSIAARLKAPATSENFFLEYCRAIVTETTRSNLKRTPGYTANLQAYMVAVDELTRLGEHRGDTTRITLSLADQAHLQKTMRILFLLGWKVVDENGATRMEPGDQPADGPRQQIPSALGIDEVAMQQALESGGTFQFEIRSENASLTGGSAWGALVPGFYSFPGGLAEAFVREPKLAKTYAALTAMPADASAATVKRAGLRSTAAEYSEVLWLYSDGFKLANGVVAIPGGAEAEKVWTKLAGASPRDPPAFLHALLASDSGRVAAFYSALSHADDAHQRFFTKSVARAERFYSWYRDSDELKTGIGKPGRAWRPLFFQKVPLDNNGNVRFPGGRAAWSASSAADDEGLLHLSSLEGLVAVAQLEEKRGAEFDDISAKLLAQHFNEWRALFPYFEELPGMGRGEFEALAAFSKGVSGYRRPVMNLVTGEWHALVALIVLGRKAGSLDAPAGVQAFRRVCEGLLADDYSAKAVALLRQIAGGNQDLDEAVASGLLRLTGTRRDAFDRVRELQNAPSLESLKGSPDPEKTLAALTGLVYGVELDPESLLVNEDPGLLSKHQYVPDSCGTCGAASVERMNLFSSTALLASTIPPGSHVSGGFMQLKEVARDLVHGGKAMAATPPSAPRAEGPARPTEAESVPAEAIIRANARLVQAYASITDSRGRYVDDLAAGQFTVLDDGQPVRIAAFENETSDISCALLLDTTESMQATLPALKNAALTLIRELRTNDAVAVYSLRGGVSELQPFTADKSAATRAVLQTEPGGMTALYDGLVRVIRDMSGRAGKKVIVVFTDGDDNISTLTADSAIVRAKTSGVPIYTIGQGAALDDESLLKQLTVMARATGGLSFTIHSPNEIRGIFEKVVQDLLHGYLLAFQPSDAEGHAWHTIEVVLQAPKGRKVRAREGYFPE
jgi:Ca-activated chloride channel family protein